MTALLLALMRLREWFGPPSKHGAAHRRPVEFRVGHMRVRRLYGSTARRWFDLIQTGARMRADGWQGPGMAAMRVSIRWPHGAIAISEAPKRERVA